MGIRGFSSNFCRCQPWNIRFFFICEFLGLFPNDRTGSSVGNCDNVVLFKGKISKLNCKKLVATSVEIHTALPQKNSSLYKLCDKKRGFEPNCTRCYFQQQPNFNNPFPPPLFLPYLPFSSLSPLHPSTKTLISAREKRGECPHWTSLFSERDKKKLAFKKKSHVLLQYVGQILALGNLHTAEEDFTRLFSTPILRSF